MRLNCIVCGEHVENEGDEGQNHPHAATAFMTHGHYGSTAFDPMDGTFLEINVCDPCLVRRAGEGFVVKGQDHRRADGEMKKIPYDEQPALKTWTPWNPNRKDQK